MAPIDSLIQSIVADAEKNVSVLRIQSASSLLSFLKTECLQSGTPFRETYDEAVRQGLLICLGNLYRSKLDAALRAVRDDIVSGFILSDDELRASLERQAAISHGAMPAAKVFNDLLIDARHCGLYEMLPDAEESRNARFQLIAQAA